MAHTGPTRLRRAADEERQAHQAQMAAEAESRRAVERRAYEAAAALADTQAMLSAQTAALEQARAEAEQARPQWLRAQRAPSLCCTHSHAVPPWPCLTMQCLDGADDRYDMICTGGGGGDGTVGWQSVGGP